MSGHFFSTNLSNPINNLERCDTVVGVYGNVSMDVKLNVDHDNAIYFN